MKQAQQYAQQYAAQTGLTLGSILSVSDVPGQNNGYGYYYYGPFGPGQYCGTIREGHVRVINKKRKVTFKRVAPLLRAAVRPQHAERHLRGLVVELDLVGGLDVHVHVHRRHHSRQLSAGG